MEGLLPFLSVLLILTAAERAANEFAAEYRPHGE
jgi:hypothetical protein